MFFVLFLSWYFHFATFVLRFLLYFSLKFVDFVKFSHPSFQRHKNIIIKKQENCTVVCIYLYMYVFSVKDQSQDLVYTKQTFYH